MKRKISVLLTLLLGISLYAQSADVITDLLESEKATFGQVCYLAGVQQDIISEDTSYENAVQVLYEKGIIPNSEDPQAPIPLVDIAYIYSRLWPIQGGLMFRLTKGSPRYAFKQFQSDGIINKKQEPSDFVTGAKALSIYTACVNRYSGFDMKSVSMEIEE
jgi:hypothetical protein